MDAKNEWKKLLAIIAVFVGCFYLPIGFGLGIKAFSFLNIGLVIIFSSYLKYRLG